MTDYISPKQFSGVETKVWIAEGDNKPYLAVDPESAYFGGWFFYWHPDNKWVSMREYAVPLSEIPDNLTIERQSMYNKLHNENS